MSRENDAGGRAVTRLGVRRAGRDLRDLRQTPHRGGSHLLLVLGRRSGAVTERRGDSREGSGSSPVTAAAPHPPPPAVAPAVTSVGGDGAGQRSSDPGPWPLPGGWCRRQFPRHGGICGAGDGALPCACGDRQTATQTRAVAPRGESAAAGAAGRGGARGRHGAATPVDVPRTLEEGDAPHGSAKGVRGARQQPPSPTTPVATAPPDSRLQPRGWRPAPAGGTPNAQRSWPAHG